MTASLGLGTYRVRGLPEAAKAAVNHGADWIDTAPNYLHGHAEQDLKPVLAAYPQVPVSTKVGFFTPEQARRALAAGALTDREAKAGHCLSPRAIIWQAEESRAALGRVPDITFVHNPEHGLHDRGALEKRLYEAFVVLENCVDLGLTKGYGVATWNAIHEDLVSVDRVAGIAKQSGLGVNRLKAIQLPLSIVQIGPLAEASQGHGPLVAAQAQGIDVFASAPLHGGELLGMLPDEVAEELIPGASPLRVALGVVASTKGVTRLLLSASSTEHWADAAAAISRPILTPHVRRIVDAFSP
ncbi:aldo/keto reductase [Streptomyces sp. NPDC057496]|uniref:aldo/keto reductase n=1 Tax=Streptomyces sp. NPDC057496 TaxID=3346149 RepID=UPI0036814D15